MTIAQQRGIDRHVFLAPRPDSKPGLGTSENPFRVRDAGEFDAKMRSLPERVSVELASGVTFETMGHTEGDGNPLTNWSPKAGWVISGGGMGNTTLKIVGNEHDSSVPYRAATVAIGGDYNLRPHLCCVHDLTIDCNLDNQPKRNVACGAIYLAGGNHVTVERVRAINFGTRSPAECFVIALRGGNKDFGEAGDLTVSKCILKQPCSTSAGGGITAILIGGVGERALVRGNFIEGGTQYKGTLQAITTGLRASLVEGNFIADATAGWYYDSGEATVSDVTIRNNTMRRVKWGLRVDFYPATVPYRIERILFSDNDVELAADGEAGVALLGHRMPPPERNEPFYSFDRVECARNRFVGLTPQQVAFATHRAAICHVHGNHFFGFAPQKQIDCRLAENVRAERNVDGALADANEIYRGE